MQKKFVILIFLLGCTNLKSKSGLNKIQVNQFTVENELTFVFCDEKDQLEQVEGCVEPTKKTPYFESLVQSVVDQHDKIVSLVEELKIEGPSEEIKLEKLYKKFFIEFQKKRVRLKDLGRNELSSFLSINAKTEIIAIHFYTYDFKTYRKNRQLSLKRIIALKKFLKNKRINIKNIKFYWHIDKDSSEKNINNKVDIYYQNKKEI
jgi:hypothetical protein